MIGGIELARPWALLLLLLVPLLVLAAVRDRRRAARLALPTSPILVLAGRGALARVAWLPAALRIAAVALCAVALARPVRAGPHGQDLSVEGIDIVVALDLSTSMNALDFAPQDRLGAAKNVLDAFVARRPSDRLGLVVFAGEAYTQCPLTLDHGVLRSILADLRTGAIEDGTAIGNALATSVNRLRDSDARSRVIILITDGDSNAGNISPRQAAQLARELGIKVFTIMVGQTCDDPRGCPVPVPAQDAFGRTVTVQRTIPVNPDLLREIAETTSGSFYVATDRASLEGNLQDVLARLEKSRVYESAHLAALTDEFHLMLLPAFLLLCAEVLLSATRLRTFP